MLDWCESKSFYMVCETPSYFKILAFVESLRHPITSLSAFEERCRVVIAHYVGNGGLPGDITCIVG